MKSIFITIVLILILFVSNIHSQERAKPKHPDLKNISSLITLDLNRSEFLFVENPLFSDYLSGKNYSETTIGDTEYDLQSNAAVCTRIRLHPNGTIGATWTRGTGNFANRGTGYNFFDGTSWGSIPTQRLESRRTGWPSYAAWNDGEIIVAHTDLNDLILLRRPTLGTGTWEEISIPEPPTADLTWARMVVVDNSIHVIVNSRYEYQGMKQALIYFFSHDGGISWQNYIIPGMTSAEMRYIGGDVYAWAEPKNGILAFVVGDKWSDVFLMKSTDNGNTWTKTLIFQHPYPSPMWQNPPIYADTTYVCDGSLAVELDANGNAHVVFGIQRVLYDPAEDPNNEGLFSYFPFTDGLAYWKEGMPQLTNLNPNDLHAQGNLIGWIQDVDGSGYIMDNLTSINELAKYYLSLSTMPQITIDDSNNIYVVFVSPNETCFSGTQFYNHLWLRVSKDGGQTWGHFYELTGGVLHEYDECVFGSMSKTSDDYIHIVFQLDDEPGLHVRGDQDPIRNNDIIYLKVKKQDILSAKPMVQADPWISTEVYPNPATDNITLKLITTTSTTAKISLTDITGKIIHSNTITLQRSSTYESLNIANLNSGIYFINIQTPDHLITHKFVKK